GPVRRTGRGADGRRGLRGRGVRTPSRGAGPGRGRVGGQPRGGARSGGMRPRRARPSGPGGRGRGLSRQAGPDRPAVRRGRCRGHALTPHWSRTRVRTAVHSSGSARGAPAVAAGESPQDLALVLQGGGGEV